MHAFVVVTLITGIKAVFENTATHTLPYYILSLLQKLLLHCRHIHDLLAKLVNISNTPSL